MGSEAVREHAFRWWLACNCCAVIWGIVAGVMAYKRMDDKTYVYST